MMTRLERLIVSALMFGACVSGGAIVAITASNNADRPAPLKAKRDLAEMSRFHYFDGRMEREIIVIADSKRDVTCWLLEGGLNGPRSISCLQGINYHSFRGGLAK